MKFRSSGKDYSKKELFDKGLFVVGAIAGGFVGVFELAPLAIETGMATSTMGGGIAQTAESLTVIFGVTSAAIGCEAGNVTRKIVDNLSSRISGKNGKNEDAGFSVKEMEEVLSKIERVSGFNPDHATAAFKAAVRGEKSKVKVILAGKTLSLKQKGLKPF